MPRMPLSPRGDHLMARAILAGLLFAAPACLVVLAVLAVLAVLYVFPG